MPLHHAVIREGLFKFVTSIPRGAYFFGELSGRTDERKVAGASQNDMRWLRKVVGITAPRLVSYSWRHRVEDQLREIDAPEEVAAAITGRTRTGSRAGYGKGPSLETKLRWLSKVPTLKVDPKSGSTKRQLRGPPDDQACHPLPTHDAHVTSRCAGRSGRSTEPSLNKGLGKARYVERLDEVGRRCGRYVVFSWGITESGSKAWAHRGGSGNLHSGLGGVFA